MPPSETFFDLAEQRLNPPGRCWGNLGLWPAAPLLGTAGEYADACEQLAHTLAAAAGLGPGSVVLDAGFGCGDQLLLWRADYRVAQLFGINFSSLQTGLAQQRLQQQAQQQQDEVLARAAQQCIQGDACDARLFSDLSDAGINCVLALDCIYHFPDKLHFWQQATALLQHQPKGVIACTDLNLCRPLADFPWLVRCLLTAMLRASSIPLNNLQTVEQSRTRLQQLTAGNVSVVDLSDRVMPRFGVWFAAFRRRQTGRRWSPGWLKYQLTGAFLQQAWRRGWLSYTLIRAELASEQPMATPEQ